MVVCLYNISSEHNISVLTLTGKCATVLLFIDQHFPDPQETWFPAHVEPQSDMRRHYREQPLSQEDVM